MLAYLHIKGCSLKSRGGGVRSRGRGVRNRGRGLEQLGVTQVAEEGSLLSISRHLGYFNSIVEHKACVETRSES